MMLVQCTSSPVLLFFCKDLLLEDHFHVLVFGLLENKICLPITLDHTSAKSVTLVQQ